MGMAYPVIPAPDRTQGSLALPRGVGVTSSPASFVRGKITAWNVTAQQQVGSNMSVQLAYVGNRQEDMTRSTNRNYGQIGGGVASQPFFQSIGTNAAINFLDPLGRVHYDALQLHVSRRLANGFSFTAAYTRAKGTDFWATGILIPEYSDLNRGPSSNVSPNKVDLAATYELPFGEGKRFLQSGVGAALLGGWQVNGNFTAFSGSVMTMTANGASLNAPGSAQRADQVADFKVIGDVGPNAYWFDPTSFAPVTQQRFGTSKANGYRGPGYANLDASLFKGFRFSRFTGQFRLEALNVTNTPHFANPGTNINAADFGRVTFTANPGREFDERSFRLGLRMSF